jgi:hypothetical protein
VVSFQRCAQKKSDLSRTEYILLAEEILLQKRFYRVYELPLLRNAQKRNKKSSKRNRGKKQKKEEKTPKNWFFVFFNSLF